MNYVAFLFLFSSVIFSADGGPSVPVPGQNPIIPTPISVVAQSDAMQKLPEDAVHYEEKHFAGDDGKGGKIYTTISGYKRIVEGKSIEVGTKFIKVGDFVYRKSFFDNEGKKEGVWTEYYPNGYPNGKIKLINTYKSDLADGPSVFYNTNGIPMLIKWFVKGQETGISVAISPDGRVTTAEKYLDGKIVETMKNK